MITSLDRRVIDILKGPDTAQRKYITGKSLVYHAIYYHPEFFDYAIPPFHWDLYDDFECLVKGELKEAVWAAYRESAKTSIAKIGLEWIIVNRKKWYLNVDCYDKANSESILFDVAVSLQSNPKIIRDYGQLYYRSEDKEQSGIKRIGNFITENDIRVEAHSTQQSTRGRVYGKRRPDFYLFDDIETNNTKDSYAKTAQVKKHVAEASAGLGVNGCALYLGNLIVEDGTIAQVMADLTPRTDAVVRNIPVINPQTKAISWPDKYVMTKLEAFNINQTITNPDKRKVAIEAKQEQLKAYFEPEMMNNPSKSGDYLFDRDIVEAKIALAKPPLKTIAGHKIWYEYKAGHRYGSGTDTSEGNGLDAGTHAIIDYTPIPNRLVSTFKSNALPPDELAFEVAREGALYAFPYEGTEINNTGWATVVTLKSRNMQSGAPVYPLERLYQRRELSKLNNQEMNEIGWRTTAATKPGIIFDLITAVQDGALEILDEEVLTEMKYYARRDLLALKHEEGMTRHFDLLMAVAIAWAMRNFAPLPKEVMLANIPKQAPYEPSSIYESAGGVPHKPLNQLEDKDKRLDGRDWPTMIDQLMEEEDKGYTDFPLQGPSGGGDIY